MSYAIKIFRNVNGLGYSGKSHSANISEPNKFWKYSVDIFSQKAEAALNPSQPNREEHLCKMEEMGTLEKGNHDILALGNTKERNAEYGEICTLKELKKDRIMRDKI